jgi:hypothetical protein
MCVGMSAAVSPHGCHGPGFSWEARNYVFWGTVDYASVRTLRGHHPTPRDDLESMACALLEMATGACTGGYAAAALPNAVAMLKTQQVQVHVALAECGGAWHVHAEHPTSAM